MVKQWARTLRCTIPVSHRQAITRTERAFDRKRIRDGTGGLRVRRTRHISVCHHFVLAGGVAADQIGRAATSEFFRHGYKTP